MIKPLNDVVFFGGFNELQLIELVKKINEIIAKLNELEEGDNNE